MTTKSAAGSYIFLKPFEHKVGYMERKLREADSNPHLLFGCINSLGETTETEQRMFEQWITNRLNVIEIK